MSPQVKWNQWKLCGLVNIFTPIESWCGTTYQTVEHSELLLTSYPCLLVSTSSVEENQSVPVLNMSLLWVIILEVWQKFQPLKTIWSLSLLTILILSLLHAFLQRCNLTYPHVHHEKELVRRGSSDSIRAVVMDECCSHCTNSQYNTEKEWKHSQRIVILCQHYALPQDSSHKKQERLLM